MLEKWFKSSALALMLMFVQCTHLRFVHWTHQHQRACTGFESFLSQQDLRIYWPIIKYQHTICANLKMRLDCQPIYWQCNFTNWPVGNCVKVPTYWPPIKVYFDMCANDILCGSRRLNWLGLGLWIFSIGYIDRPRSSPTRSWVCEKYLFYMVWIAQARVAPM